MDISRRRNKKIYEKSMKLVREHINEFKQGQDPYKTMELGKYHYTLNDFISLLKKHNNYYDVLSTNPNHEYYWNDDFYINNSNLELSVTAFVNIPNIKLVWCLFDDETMYEKGTMNFDNLIDVEKWLNNRENMVRSIEQRSITNGKIIKENLN
jgi:hypothetical protein